MMTNASHRALHDFLRKHNGHSVDLSGKDGVITISCIPCETGTVIGERLTASRIIEAFAPRDREREA